MDAAERGHAAKKNLLVHKQRALSLTRGCDSGADAGNAAAGHENVVMLHHRFLL